MAIPPNLLAAAAEMQVGPKTRRDLQRLLAEQGDAPPMQIQSILEEPAAPPATVWGRGSSLAATGGMVPGGRPDEAGMDKIGWDPKAAPKPAERKVLGFHDTAGGKMVAEAIEKRKKLQWWMPDFMANRNERAIAQGIDLARAEMGGSEGQDVSAQRWANLLSDQENAKARQTSTMAELSRREDEGRQRMKEHADRLSLDRDQLVQRAREASDSNADRDASRSQAERLSNLTKGAEATAGASKVVPPLYDVGSDDPASTGVFAKFAQGILKDDPQMPAEDVQAAVSNASRAGALPRMMSTRADRPRTAVDPKTGKRFYVYKSGRVEPAP